MQVKQASYSPTFTRDTRDDYETYKDDMILHLKSYCFSR